MKILIDEQLPTKLKYIFSDTEYDVFTVRDMKWLGQEAYFLFDNFLTSATLS